MKHLIMKRNKCEKKWEENGNANIMMKRKLKRKNFEKANVEKVEENSEKTNENDKTCEKYEKC